MEWKIAFFVLQCWLYSAPRSLPLPGVVVDVLLRQGVGCPVQWGPFPACHASTALASALTVGGRVGSANWVTMRAAVGKLQYAVNAPWWWASWVLGSSRESASLM